MPEFAQWELIAGLLSPAQFQSMSRGQFQDKDKVGQRAWGQPCTQVPELIVACLPSMSQNPLQAKAMLASSPTFGYYPQTLEVIHPDKLSQAEQLSSRMRSSKEHSSGRDGSKRNTKAFTAQHSPNFTVRWDLVEPFPLKGGSTVATWLLGPVKGLSTLPGSVAFILRPVALLPLWSNWAAHATSKKNRPLLLQCCAQGGQAKQLTTLELTWG